jgi:glutaredoxin
MLSPHAAESILQLQEMTKFTAKSESILLLLEALKDPNYKVEPHWKETYLERKPLRDGLMAVLNSGPNNRFTKLLSEVGLPGNRLKEGKGQQKATNIRDDALQLYRLSRQDWVSAMRKHQGFTVFSKSYCPFSRRAKALLESLHANVTIYEVDLRPDAEQLQPLLAALTGYRTFPTILVRDRLLGGSDDLASLHSLQALKSILSFVGAL